MMLVGLDRRAIVIATERATSGRAGTLLDKMSVQASSVSTVSLRYCRTCCAVFRTDFLRCPSDGSPIALVDHDPMISQTIGSYVVDAFLGDGAVGRVYRVHHERLEHRQLAL